MKPYLKRAWAEISLSALEKNIRAIKSTLFRETSLMAVIKANAYGHGEDGILKKLCECGVKYFAVSNLDEMCIRDSTSLVKFDSDKAYRAYARAGTWIVNSRLRDFIFPRADQDVYKRQLLCNRRIQRCLK